jgi:thiol:disulfide interchange protein DsbD
MDSHPTSTGSLLKPHCLHSEYVACALLVAVFALAHSLPAAAVELLQPHEAFALSARAIDGQTLEARFNVADGYYLYRDKLKFNAGVPESVELKAELPPGKVKHDEFFGDVETYRGLLVIRIPMAAIESGKKLTLVTESQGCADAGVCYPPQRQTLTLDVPAAGAGPSALVDAPIGRPAWLK